MTVNASTLSYDEELQKVITDISEEYEISPQLMMALAEVESNGDTDAIGSTGDYGLMQINKMNHEWLNLKNWSDAEENTEAACKLIDYLRNTYPECEDVSCCLMAYNMGADKAQKLWNKGIYESEYSKKVTDLSYVLERECERCLNVK